MVKIVEMGPRDGLQNEKNIIESAIKIQFIQKLIAAGLPAIEMTSFVSPKWVPQMADHQTVAKHFKDEKSCELMALVPNLKGLDNAIASGVKQIGVFTAASETFTQKNINCSIRDSLRIFNDIITTARQHQIKVRGYVSCVLGCPYEGKVPVTKVMDVATALYDAGCYEISLGDTIGIGTPNQARALIKLLKTALPTQQLAIHFHDTYGQALANILACLEEDIEVIDSSVAGLGGCPYAKGASGNVATEEVLYMLKGLGLTTSVDMNKLLEAGEFICDALNIETRSKVAKALLSKRDK